MVVKSSQYAIFFQLFDISTYRTQVLFLCIFQEKNLSSCTRCIDKNTSYTVIILQCALELINVQNWLCMATLAPPVPYLVSRGGEFRANRAQNSGVNFFQHWRTIENRYGNKMRIFCTYLGPPSTQTVHLRLVEHRIDSHSPHAFRRPCTLGRHRSYSKFN